MISKRNTRMVIVLGFLLPVLNLSGCATSLTEAERYEKQALHAERMDKIRAFIATCEEAGSQPIYFGPTTHKLRDPIKRVPRHAHLSDYACATDEDVERAQREWGVRM